MSLPDDHAPTGTPPFQQTRRLAPYGTEGAAKRCRDFGRRALFDWGWLPARDEDQRVAADDVLLMVSELVTNACLHAPGGPRELRLIWDGRRLRVEVSDGSPLPPRLRLAPDRGRPGGYGLRVIERLSHGWGCAPEGEGKRVWFEVPAPLRPRSRPVDGRARSWP
ncbi:ATP-binding protein [Kitasatospora sp. NBC_00240]|uniref:ATP-binding protein n=1 Tax=Kitasatospora sp. NBC_00240 TaxID=2903567 RepID=UPI00225A5EE7|nr:ATP-binding protein [Kitasatospora sp. NBC_00240]MCX5215273.1 ATP-binding protein [Kitasatospora sp. NBC_00240]